MSRKPLRTLLRVAIPLAFWLGVWQLAALWVDLELLLPSPAAVGRSLAALARTAEFWLSALFTLLRVFLGLLGGALLGTVLAFLTHFFPWADLRTPLTATASAPAACTPLSPGWSGPPRWCPSSC